MDSIVGRLLIDLGANVARLKNDMDDAKHTVNHAMEGMTSAVEKFKSVLETLGLGIGVMEFAEFINRTAEAGEQLHLLSEKTGIAISDLTGLDLAARMNGTSLDGVSMAVKKLSTYLFDATAGLPAIRQQHNDMLQVLGVTAQAPLEALKQISDQFQKMPDGVDKSAIAVKLFGKTGIDMIPMLNQGGEALTEWMDEGKKLNPVAEEFSKHAVEFEHSMKKVQIASKNNAMIFTDELLPGLNDIATAFLNGSQNAEAFKTAGAMVSDVLKGLVIGADTLVYMFKETGTRIVGLAEAGWELAHGHLAAAQAINDEMNKNHQIAKKEYEDFIGVIIDGQKKIQDAESAAPKTDNHVALRLKAIDDQRKAEAAAAKESLAWNQAVADNYAKELDRIDKANKAYQKTLESYNPAALEMKKYKGELDALAHYHDLSTTTTAEYNQLAEGIEQEHQAKMLQIGVSGQMTANQFEVQTLQTQIGIVAGILSNATNQAAQHNRVMFEINKQAKAADAVISTFAGINKALGEFPYPLNFAIAGIVGAAGFANVASIESASFGGGSSGSAPSASGGAGSIPGQTANPNVIAAPATAAVQAPQQINLTIQGAKTNPDAPLMSYNSVVNDLIPLLQKASGNGFNVNVVMA